MSRLHKKHPFSGITTSDTEKQGKREYNQRDCRALRMVLHVDRHVIVSHCCVSTLTLGPWAKTENLALLQERFPKLMYK